MADYFMSYKGEEVTIWDERDRTEDIKIATFEHHDDARAFIIDFSKGKSITLIDDKYQMWLKVTDGKVEQYSFEYEDDYKAVSLWLGEPIEEYEEYNCSACRDGGCFHCEPHRFIDGYIKY